MRSKKYREKKNKKQDNNDWYRHFDSIMDTDEQNTIENRYMHRILSDKVLNRRIQSNINTAAPTSLRVDVELDSQKIRNSTPLSENGSVINLIDKESLEIAESRENYPSRSTPSETPFEHVRVSRMSRSKNLVSPMSSTRSANPTMDQEIRSVTVSRVSRTNRINAVAHEQK